MVKCHICGELAAVRKNTAGRLYYVCHCGGPVPLHGQRGQEYVLTNGKLWGEGIAPPDDAPDWIKRGLGFPPGERGDRRPQAPAKAPASSSPSSPPSSSSSAPPAPAPEPQPEPKPRAVPARVPAPVGATADDDEGIFW